MTTILCFLTVKYQVSKTEKLRKPTSLPTHAYIVTDNGQAKGNDIYRFTIFRA